MLNCVFITRLGPNGHHLSSKLVWGDPVSPIFYKVQDMAEVFGYLRLKKNPRFCNDLVTDDALDLSSSLLLAPYV